MNLPVNNRDELILLLNQNKEAILAFGVKRMGVFGSFSRNDVNQNSDVDFVVEFVEGQKSYDNFIGLAYFLEDLLGRKIELVTPQSLSPYIGPRIMKEVEYVVAA